MREVLLPVHWGLFNLGRHGWTEPVERTLAAAERMGCAVVTPRPGVPVLFDEPVASARWWPEIPWLSAEDTPIVATGEFSRAARPGLCLASAPFPRQ